MANPIFCDNFNKVPRTRNLRSIFATSTVNVVKPETHFKNKLLQNYFENFELFQAFSFIAKAPTNRNMYFGNEEIRIEKN
jgi:hypothetical protein